MRPEQIKRLLGAELAQDDPNFLRYAVRKSGVLDALRNPDNRFQIINAARGSGKSGLLICHAHDIQTTFGEKHVVIRRFHADAPLPENLSDFHSSLNFWKNTILGWLVSEIGALTQAPIDNDEVSAANYAEQIGRKEIDSVLAQLRINQSPDQKTVYSYDLSDAYISRIVEKSGRTFWLLLDEMDDYYENLPRFHQRLIGLLKAAKYVSGLHKNIRLRITIRPHIMTTLMRASDVGSTFRGDILDLDWNEKELLRLLAARINHYDGSFQNQFALFPDEESTRKTEYAELSGTIAKYFDPFDGSFSEHKETDFRALMTFSLGRPRWMIEFCSLALAYSETERAGVRDFKRAAAEFGRNRIIFLAGEHSHHFPDLEQVINQVAGERKVSFGTSEELRSFLVSAIVRTGVRPVRRDGVEAGAIASLEDNAALKVAQDLYMIEFIRARQKAGGRDNHRFYTYPERPSLLASWASDRSIMWEMHPIFARSLNIVDSNTFRTGGKYRLFGDKKPKR